MRGLYISIVFLLALFSATSAGDDAECVYTLYVKTGDKLNAGTDSKIKVTIADKYGGHVQVENLQSWGLMKSGHDYFERGNVDIFAVRGACNVSTPVCRLELTSDGSGALDAWYCDYVQVTSASLGKQCSYTLFDVKQWLSKTIAPFHLTAVVDVCNSLEESSKLGMQGRRFANYREFA